MIIGNSSRSLCVWIWLWVHTSEHARCPACVCAHDELWFKSPPLPSITPAGIRVIIDHRTPCDSGMCVCACVCERHRFDMKKKTKLEPLSSSYYGSMMVSLNETQREREREGGGWNRRPLSSSTTDSHTHDGQTVVQLLQWQKRSLKTTPPHHQFPPLPLTSLSSSSGSEVAGDLRITQHLSFKALLNCLVYHLTHWSVG